MKNVYEVIRRPLLTEKSTLLKESQQTLVFEVHRDALTPDDLLRDVYIRGERHSVIQALNRQLTHHSYHVGQIVFLAKHFRSAEWKTLSIPRKRRA